MKDIEYKNIIHNTIVPEMLSTEEQEGKYATLVKFLGRNIPEHLYRFRKCDENSISAFDKDQIWFSPPAEMNDDFDALMFFNKQNIHSSLEQFFNKFSDFVLKDKSIDEFPDSVRNTMSSEVLSIIKAQLEKMSSGDTVGLINQIHDFMIQQIETGLPLVKHIIQNKLKIACFSEVINSAAMWGYYGDYGKGFALAYDFRNYMYTDCAICNNRMLCPSSQNANLYPIIYDDTPFNATEYARYLLQQQMLQTIVPNEELYDRVRGAILCPDLFMSTKVLLHKSTSWKHEYEWRLVYDCRNNTMLSEKFVYVKKKPSAIYLGRKISSTYEKLLRYIAAEKNMPVYKMTMDEDESAYSLVPKLI